MSTTAFTPPALGAVREIGRATAAGRAYRTEARKLGNQVATRVLAVVCVLGPLAFAGILNTQTGAPADTMFGVWVHSSGFAISLVLLSFAGVWGFPVIAGVLAGDMFSSEDRYGTWKTVLTRSCRRSEVFIGKVLAAATFAVALTTLAAIATITAGVVFVGDQSLVNLTGTLMSPGKCLALVAVSWLVSIFPMLAFTALAVLFSVSTRNGILGVLGPSLVGLAFQLLQLVGTGVWVHTLLITSAFDGWHGLFTTHRFYGQLVLSIVVSLLWTAGCLAAAWRLLRRRDFAGAPISRRQGWSAPVRTVAVIAIVIAVLALAGNLGPDSVTAARLQASIEPTFNNLTLLQQRELGRTVPAGTKLNVLTSCTRRSGSHRGPGDDWVCTLNVLIPQAGAVPFQYTPVTYDLGVKSNGCYKAEAPPTFVGQLLMKDARGRNVVNPLFVIYGCFEP